MTPGTRGWTFRSTMASLFAILLAAILCQQITATQGWDYRYSWESIPVAAYQVVLALLLSSAAAFAMFRTRLLTRAEMTFVLCACVSSAPLLSAGFWRMMLSTSVTVVRNSNLADYDGLDPRFWPHGPNLLAGAFSEPGRDRLEVRGSAEWLTDRAVQGRDAMPVLRLRADAANAGQEQRPGASMRLELPLRGERTPGVSLGEMHAFLALIRAGHLAPGSFCYCRIYYDGDPIPGMEPVRSTTGPTKTYLFPTGFVRLGTFNLEPPVTVHDKVTVEFGLDGAGEVDFADPQFLSVDALHSAYSGRKEVTRSEWRALPPERRGGLLVRPDSMWSLDGLRYLAVGQFPWRDWLRPLSVWMSFYLLLLTGSAVVGLLMRRQWVQNERNPMPMLRVPLALLGEEDDGRALAAIWRRPAFWAGLTIVALWGILRGAHEFNPGIPGLDVGFDLKPYLPQAAWGKTWNSATFLLNGMVIGIGLLMELNVLLSIVAGFFLYRLQFLFGEQTGLATDPRYPYAAYQQFFAMQTWALLILAMSWRYLYATLRQAVRGATDPDDTVSPRWALMTLVACLVGVAALARWLALPASAIVGFFTLALLFCLMSAKLRTECGAPDGQFLQGATFALGATMLGGMTVFAPQGMAFVVLVVSIVHWGPFFLIPGLQFECTELGRRMGLRRRDPLVALALGAVAALALGGWVYFSNMYSVGAESYRVVGHFSGLPSFWGQFDEALVKANPLATGTVAPPSRVSPQIVGGLFAAITTAALVALRAFFPGFWFHPVGFILGSTEMAFRVWGSFLVAWVIRLLVLKIGGAATVRERLVPFAIGMIAGTFVHYTVFTFVNGFVGFFKPGGTMYIVH